jgi:N-acetyl-gamma-glutamyl-phosphate reductase
VDQATIDAAYAEAYAGQRFVRVLRDRVPQPGPLVFTNLCDVRATLDARAGVVLAFGAIDNLVKGAAGQAVQNFNHLLGLDPATALAAKGMS